MFITLKSFVIFPCLDIDTATTVGLLKISTRILLLVVIVVMKLNFLTYLSLFIEATNSFIRFRPIKNPFFLFLTFFPRFLRLYYLQLSQSKTF